MYRPVGQKTSKKKTWDLCPAEFFQVEQMRGNGFEHRSVFDIRDIIFPAGLPDKPAYLRVMNMTDAWEQMVLDLKIQTAQQPVQEPAGSSDVGCRFLLMNRPRLLAVP